MEVQNETNGMISRPRFLNTKYITGQPIAKYKTITMAMIMSMTEPKDIPPPPPEVLRQVTSLYISIVITRLWKIKQKALRLNRKKDHTYTLKLILIHHLQNNEEQ